MNTLYNPYHPANIDIIKNTAGTKSGASATLVEAVDAEKAKLPGVERGSLNRWLILVYPQNGIIFMAASGTMTALRLPDGARERALQAGAATSFPVKG